MASKTANAGTGGRRAFFRWLARESATKLDEMRGRPQMRLNELRALPIAELAVLEPGVLPGIQILPEATRVLARLPGRPEPVPLFTTEPMLLAIFNRFNGLMTIAEVAEAVCIEMGEPAEKAFGHTRGLFLHLAELGVCAPFNLPPPPGGKERT
jgi:hypothetical protein